MSWMDDKAFTQLAQKHFAFLQNDYNMHVKDKEVTACVSFQSSITWIEIWYDKYSLFIEIGTNDGLYQTSLWDVMQFLVGDGNSASYMASNIEKLDVGLRKLSDYVKLYCSKALSGDVEFYRKIQISKNKYEQKCAINNKISYIEELAKTAWEKRDYIRIINLYEPIIEHLSPIQKKRYDICKKMVDY